MNEVTSSETVECSDCGHIIEQHDPKGCKAVDGCTCPTGWTIAQIKKVRRDCGLSGEWRDR